MLYLNRVTQQERLQVSPSPSTLWTAAAVAATGVPMGCGSAGDRQVITRAAWSDGTTTGQFISFLQLQVNRAKKARVAVILEGSSGNLTVSAAAIYGNTEDGIAAATTMIDLPATAPTSRTTDGASYPASYTDLDVAAQIVEVGIKARNTSGVKREMGTVTLIIDFSD